MEGKKEKKNTAVQGEKIRVLPNMNREKEKRKGQA